MILFIRILAWIISKTPDFILRGFCILLGRITYYGSKRGHLVCTNLHHAFPEKPVAWVKVTAKENLTRMFEMFLLPFGMSYMSDRALHKRIQVEPESLKLLNEMRKHRGTIVLSPHTTLTEYGPYKALKFEIPPMGVFYRPLDYKPLDEFIKQVRGRYVTMLSRKEGLLQSGEYLKNKHWIGILFDQNAGDVGTYTLFFDRIVSATELPALLSKKYNARMALLYFKRLGFRKAELSYHLLPEIEDVKEKTAYLQYAFEEHLKSNEEEIVDWFWAHNRWKAQRSPEKLFNLEHKKMAIEEALRLRGLKELPRKLALFLRLPDSPQTAEAMMPLVSEMRMARPDLHVTLLGYTEVLEACNKTSEADAVLSVPREKSDYDTYLKTLPDLFPEIFMVSENNPCALTEAKKSKARQRIGIRKQSERIGELNLTWECPSTLESASLTDNWRLCLQHFGLPQKAGTSTD